MGFGALFGSRGEADDRQQGTDQQHQQVDFHVFLRCPVAVLAIPDRHKYKNRSKRLDGKRVEQNG